MLVIVLNFPDNDDDEDKEDEEEKEEDDEDDEEEDEEDEEEEDEEDEEEEEEDEEEKEEKEEEEEEVLERLEAFLKMWFGCNASGMNSNKAWNAATRNRNTMSPLIKSLCFGTDPVWKSSCRVAKTMMPESDGLFCWGLSTDTTNSSSCDASDDLTPKWFNIHRSLEKITSLDDCEAEEARNPLGSTTWTTPVGTKTR